MLSMMNAPLAFAPAAVVPRAPVATHTSVNMVAKELEDLANDLNPAIGYFDPLGLGTADFWSKGNDATVGWLRHAEIKHGRVAMFAFVGYIAQYNGLHFGFPLSLPESPSYAEGLTPPEQWDALPIESKFQILVFIGFLEFWGELGMDKHYMKGGKPGDYPEFPAKNVIPFTPLGVLNLYDPLNFSKNRSPEAKAKGLLAEINNGRLAMIGIIGFLAEQKVPGSVPYGPHLKAYAGEVMAPLM
jgi:hypothetical protein